MLVGTAVSTDSCLRRFLPRILAKLKMLKKDLSGKFSLKKSNSGESKREDTEEVKTQNKELKFVSGREVLDSAATNL